MAASSAMEHAGIPIDTELFARLRRHWTDIQDELIADIDADFGVFEGRTFKAAKFEAYLIRAGIPWARLASGALDLKSDTFRQMAKSYAAIAPLQELRHALSDMRLNDLQVGDDGRNRTVLWAFQSKTGRNQPSNTKFIFGPSVWLRGLIKPPPGYGVAYVDWSTQEFGIAAKLSADQTMSRLITAAIPTSRSANKAAGFRRMRPKARTRVSERCSSNVFWAPNTEWVNTRWLGGWTRP